MNTLMLSLRLLKKTVMMGTPFFLMIIGRSLLMIETACSFVSTDSHHITSQPSLSWIIGKNAPDIRAGSIESITDAERRTLWRRLVVSLVWERAGKAGKYAEPQNEKVESVESKRRRGKRGRIQLG